VKLFLLLSGMALCGALLMACEHRVHAQPANVRRRGWLKYFVYLVYVGAMVSVRWWGWWPAVVAAGLLGTAASVEVVRLLRSRPLVATGLVSLVLVGLAHLLLLDRSPWSDVLLLIAAADSFAQLIGRLFGRHQLCPTISPGKTVEGFVGGVAAAVALAVAMTFLWPEKAMGTSLLLGACTALAATSGDLFFSWIKRRSQVKDFSSAIPGHGGFLDRIDSLVFAAPAFYWVARAVSGS